ncbi:piggyBac transposable element-derived protein 4 [Linepithema humile]|uniref:piggyBac transposable element-derived protein 4 n=1 Tax=Linepithema humile TaxID=83485 RepID=UPI00351F49B1
MDQKEKPSTFSEWSVTEMSPQERISKKSLKRRSEEVDSPEKALYGIFADPDELSSDEEWISDLKDNSSSEDENKVDISQDGIQEFTINQESPILEESVTKLITWIDDPSVLKKFSFTDRRKPISVIDKNSPVEYFNLFFTEEFYKLIIDQTNLNANRVLQKTTGSKNVRIQAWKPLDIEEFKVFLGLLFHMGNIQLPSIEHYWKTNYLYNLTVFRDHMPRNRFQLLLRMLHFDENPIDNEPPAKFNKICPAVDLFNNTMEEVYYPERNLCIDSLVLWRDCLVFKQHVSCKQYKDGVKLYLLREPDGMILKLSVCAVSRDHEISDKWQAAQIVHELMAKKLHQGHALYMDNFYTDIELSYQLLSNGIHVTGILKRNEGVPIEIIEKKLKNGELMATYSEDGISIQKWKDKREILLLSTEHKGEIVEIQGTRGKKKIPKSLLAYKRNMGGIDMVDQAFLYHPCGGKTLRWNQKLGIYMFQLLLLNSFFLYKKNANCAISWLQYRDTIIDYLLKHKGIIPSTPTLKTPTPTSFHTLNSIKIENELLLHSPKIVKKENESRAKRRKCVNCKKNQKRKDTVYSCTECPNKPALCLDCFAIFHTS